MISPDSLEMELADASRAKGNERPDELRPEVGILQSRTHPPPNAPLLPAILRGSRENP